MTNSDVTLCMVVVFIAITGFVLFVAFRKKKQ